MTSHVIYRRSSARRPTHDVPATAVESWTARIAAPDVTARPPARQTARYAARTATRPATQYPRPCTQITARTARLEISLPIHLSFG